MNSKLMKLDAPYNVIYAGGRVGRHIATLLTWSDDDAEGSVMDSDSYAVIDEGEEFPAGTLCGDAELHDCRVLCPPTGTNLYWVAQVIEHDFKQIEPVGAYYILERMRLLGCQIAFPETAHFTATLSILPLNSHEEQRMYRVKSNPHEGFYFESEGTEEEILYDLKSQLGTYRSFFLDELADIRFSTHDMELANVIRQLNELQKIEDGDDTDRT